MKFTNDFVVASIQEAADLAASSISQQYALNQIATKGVCTLEEAENMYNLAHRVLTEGSDDLIPEQLEIPEGGDGATDAVDPTLAQDAGVDADVDADADADADLNLEDLEGIILPDSEGNQYIVQGGILTPYNEDGSNADGDDDAGMPVDGGDTEDNLEEGTIVGDPTAGTQTIEENTGAQVAQVTSIEENTVFTSNSSIMANLIKNVQL